jgi:hypothetical protein
MVAYAVIHHVLLRDDFASLHRKFPANHPSAVVPSSYPICTNSVVLQDVKARINGEFG